MFIYLWDRILAEIKRHKEKNLAGSEPGRFCRIDPATAQNAAVSTFRELMQRQIGFGVLVVENESCRSFFIIPHTAASHPDKRGKRFVVRFYPALGEQLGCQAKVCLLPGIPIGDARLETEIEGLPYAVVVCYQQARAV